MGARPWGERVARRWLLLIAGVNLATLGSLTAPVVAAIPLKIDRLLPEEHRATGLATVLMLGGVAALIANPLFGALSDRTRSRYGRRRPWMLGGTLAGGVGVACLAASDSLPAVIGAWVFTQTAYNATLAAAAALLADTVPDDDRAAASGIFTAAAFIGTLPPLVLLAVLPDHADLISFVMPLFALVVVALATTVPDASAHGRRATRSRSSRPVLSRTYIAVWLQRLAMQSALSLASAFTLYMIMDRMTGDAVMATPIAMVATLAGGAGIVIGAVLGGVWSSRVQRYLPFLIAGALGLAAGASLRAVAHMPWVLVGAALIGGLAVGMYLAINLALAMRVVPAGSRGAYLGLLNVAETIPQVLGPIAAAALLRIGGGDPLSSAADNYLALYAAAAVCALLSLLTLPALRRVARYGGEGPDAPPARAGATPVKV